MYYPNSPLKARLQAIEQAEKKQMVSYLLYKLERRPVATVPIKIKNR